MALADSVPGVSGGTVAFVLGLYDDFINSLNHLISKDKEERKQAKSLIAYFRFFCYDKGSKKVS